MYSDGFIDISWTDPGEELFAFAEISNNNFKGSNSSDLTNTTESIPYLKDISLPNPDDSLILNKNNFHYYTPGKIEGDVQVKLYLSNGIYTKVFKSKTFSTLPTPLEISIESLIDGEVYGQNNVPLKASATPRNGNLFKWESNVDGVISNLDDTYCQALTPGSHTITLHVENQNGQSASESVNIEVVGLDFPTNWQEKQKDGLYCYY